jgi:hypothetical protein
MNDERNEPMAVSERELLAMTSALDEIHRATLPAMREALAEWSELQREVRRDTDEGGFSRRRFLIGGGVALGGLAFVACSSGKSSGDKTSTSAPANGANKLTGDLAVVALAAALENLAVGTYQAGIKAATAGKLGAVPPAVVTFATAAQSHHEQHAAAWNAILIASKTPPVRGVDTTVKAGVVDPAFAKLTDASGLATLALELENIAAATYLSAISTITTPAGIKTAATIEPVELQHAAILHFVLGTYPVPDAFTKIDGARPATDAIG